MFVTRPRTRHADLSKSWGEGVQKLPSRGYAIEEEQFRGWADRRQGKKLVMEDFYRDVRKHHRLLLEGDGEPVGGRWNYDQDNREPPPKSKTLGVEPPWWPEEDEIDEEVRADLDRWEREEGVQFLGEDGPRRFAVTRKEALKALNSFATTRLHDFGPYEDAILAEDRWMAHSLLSVPLNLGLLHPVEVAKRPKRPIRTGMLSYLVPRVSSDRWLDGATTCGMSTGTSVTTIGGGTL